MGLVGYGYWGPNVLRNLMSHPVIEVVGLADSNSEARIRAEKAWPHVKTFESVTELLSSCRPEAVVITTPPPTHERITIECLEASCHVLVEKPMALSVIECDRMLASAKRSKKTLLVDHTFVYHPAVEYLVEHAHKLGRLLYFDSVRVNLGGFQPRTNVLWDLAPHDLSIIDVLTGGLLPTRVTALGVHHFNREVENLCYVTLMYPGEFVAHLHLNWAAPMKVRTIMLGGSDRMAIYDDCLPAEKVKIYDKGVSVTHPTEQDFRVSYRVGDMVAPAIKHREALEGLVGHFVDCIRGEATPRTSGEAGKRIVAILEAASESLRKGGEPIAVTPEIEIKQPLKAA